MNSASSLSMDQTSSLRRSGLKSARIVLFGMIAIGACWVVIYGRNIDAFLDFGSLLLTVGGTAALLLLSFGPAGFAQAWRALTTQAAEADAIVGRRFFRMAATYSLGCGVLGALLGTVVVLTRITDPALLGPGLALALISQVYGVIQALTCYCLSVRLERSSPSALSAPEPNLTESALASGAGTLTILMVLFAVFAAVP